MRPSSPRLAQLQPFIDAIVSSVHEAVSLATANTFLVGIVAAAVAAAVTLLLRDAPQPATAADAGAIAYGAPGSLAEAPVRVDDTDDRAR